MMCLGESSGLYDVEIKEQRFSDNGEGGGIYRYGLMNKF
jgi:hypothetical protein